MKLWDFVAVCMVLLNMVSTSPLPISKTPPKGPPSVVEGPEDDLSPISLLRPYAVHSDSNTPEDYPDQFDEVVDFIQATIKRLRRSPDKQTPIFSRRERNQQNAPTNIENSSKKGRKNQKGKNRGCVLTEIHLNVTDLDLGYETKEELIFRYCSGSCDAAETTCQTRRCLEDTERQLSWEQRTMLLIESVNLNAKNHLLYLFFF
ncbi:glial cell line-derived neurotrophic factor-like isoform X2 [Phalacrocorax aristotelis]|uniref:glial cell line-derived neurotrophic factor-like isoform X2 n=1 Tax=Phalacrocorax aristotelis TaxID=126867 RepID=UPI003F4BB2E2